MEVPLRDVREHLGPVADGPLTDPAGRRGVEIGAAVLPGARGRDAREVGPEADTRRPVAAEQVLHLAAGDRALGEARVEGGGRVAHRGGVEVAA